MHSTSRYHQQLLNVKLHLSVDVVFTMQAKQWVLDFVELEDEMQGYQCVCVTPYMHCMTFHVLQHLARLSKLTCTWLPKSMLGTVPAVTSVQKLLKKVCGDPNISSYVQTTFAQNHFIEKIWLEVNHRVTYPVKSHFYEGWYKVG